MKLLENFRHLAYLYCKTYMLLYVLLACVWADSSLTAL